MVCMKPVTRNIGWILDLRKLGITSTNLLSAFERVPRENFVSKNSQYKSLEYSALAIGYGPSLNQPNMVAYLLQAL